MKFKNNKKRTIKKRVRVDDDGAIRLEDHDAFLDATGLPQEVTLKPRLKNSYNRGLLAPRDLYRGEEREEQCDFTATYVVSCVQQG